MLLARREHSTLELRQKLLKRAFPAELVEQVLHHCIEQNWLNHRRFCEMFIRTRINQGYGRQRICSDLRQKGIADSDMAKVFGETEIDWFELALAAHDKRYGRSPHPCSNTRFKEKAKRVRYLQYRGYAYDEIQYALETAFH